MPTKDKPKAKAYKCKGLFEWNKNQTKLNCNGIPVAEVVVDHDELIDSTYYKIQYADRVVAPGKYGYASKDKAIAHIVKRFKLV